MFLIKTYLDKSALHGIGVFADEFIPQGTRIWEFTLGLDRKYSMQEFFMLPPQAQTHLRRYGFAVKGVVYLPVDHDCLTNHSDDPNMIFHQEGYSIAARDIAKGEEITDNYRSFDNGFCAAFLHPVSNGIGSSISK